MLIRYVPLFPLPGPVIPKPGKGGQGIIDH